MDICKNCHEKDRNVIQCDKPMETHFNVSKHRDFLTIDKLDVCDICGKTMTNLYYCPEYDIVDILIKAKNGT